MAGNITYLGNKRYRLRLSVGSGLKRKIYSKNIKYEGKVEDGKTPRAIKTELAKFVAGIHKGQIPLQNNITFKKFVEMWKNDYAERKLAPKTFERYEELLERILPAIGHIKLQKLGPVHLNTLYSNLQEIGVKKPNIKDKKKREEEFKKLLKEDPNKTKLSNRTILHHHRLISSILNKAIQWGYTINNPAQRADPPKPKESEQSYLDDKQIKNVMAVLSEEPLKYQAAVLLDLFSGLRRGELMGLTWDNVDFENNIVKVEKASQYLSGKGIFEKDPKNKFSKREMQLPAFVMDILKFHQLDQQLYKDKKRTKRNKEKAKGKLVEDNNKVFIQRNGRPMHPDTLTKWFPKFLKKNNMEHVNWHGLRHTNISLMMSLGTDIPTAASRGGYARKETLLNTYSHLFKTKDESVADIMDDKFGPDN